jgi:hypothetical protein
MAITMRIPETSDLRVTKLAILAYVPHPRIIKPTNKTTALQMAVYKLCPEYQFLFFSKKGHIIGGR